MMSSSGILSINLSAIQSNWRLVASSLANNALCASVVKANAFAEVMDVLDARIARWERYKANGDRK